MQTKQNKTENKNWIVKKAKRAKKQKQNPKKQK